MFRPALVASMLLLTACAGPGFYAIAEHEAPCKMLHDEFPTMVDCLKRGLADDPSFSIRRWPHLLQDGETQLLSPAPSIPSRYRSA